MSPTTTDSPLPLRPGIAADAEEMADLIREGFGAYRSFAPRGWDTPRYAADPDMIRGRLTNAAAWIAVADSPDGSGLAGLAGGIPANLHRVNADEPADLAHLWVLFIRPAFFGTGLALALHDWALDEARERGFARMRLFAAAGQRRARRFYEREGWTCGEPFDDATFGMALVEYRRELQ